MIDLPGMVEMEVDTVGHSTARSKDGISERGGVKQRYANGNGGGRSAGVNGERVGKGSVGNAGGKVKREKEGIEEMGGKVEVETVKHYDADGEGTFLFAYFRVCYPPRPLLPSWNSSFSPRSHPALFLPLRVVWNASM